MADNKDFPDLTGIFDVDDSKIPERIIEKPAAEAREQQAAARPIMLRDEAAATAKKTRREQKVEKERVRQQKKEERIKRRRATLIRIGVVAALILVLVVAVAVLVSNAKRPVVSLRAAETADLSRHYDAAATVVNDPLGTGTDRLYAVFVENDYDVYGLEKGQSARITNNEGRTISGIVESITKENSDSGLIEKILHLITDAGVATNANYTVVVLPDDPTAVAEDMPVTVSVILEEHPEALAVPNAAVRLADGQAYVWLYRSFGKKLIRQDVKTGFSSDGKTEIAEGLDKGDLVAVEWSCDEAELHSGIRVKASAEQDPEGTSVTAAPAPAETAAPVETAAPTAEGTTAGAPVAEGTQAAAETTAAAQTGTTNPPGSVG